MSLLKDRDLLIEKKSCKSGDREKFSIFFDGENQSEKQKGGENS